MLFFERERNVFSLKKNKSEKKPVNLLKDVHIVQLGSPDGTVSTALVALKRSVDLHGDRDLGVLRKVVGVHQLGSNGRDRAALSVDSDAAVSELEQITFGEFTQNGSRMSKLRHFLFLTSV